MCGVEKEQCYLCIIVHGCRSVINLNDKLRTSLLNRALSRVTPDTRKSAFQSYFGPEIQGISGELKLVS